VSARISEGHLTTIRHLDGTDINGGVVGITSRAAPRLDKGEQRLAWSQGGRPAFGGFSPGAESREQIGRPQWHRKTWCLRSAGVFWLGYIMGLLMVFINAERVRLPAAAATPRPGWGRRSWRVNTQSLADFNALWRRFFRTGLRRTRVGPEDVHRRDLARDGSRSDPGRARHGGMGVRSGADQRPSWGWEPTGGRCERSRKIFRSLMVL